MLDLQKYDLSGYGTAKDEMYLQQFGQTGTVRHDLG